MCTSEHYEDAVRACLNDPVALRIIGDLVARRFFLEIRGFSCFSNGVAMCSGHIECRARNGSEELRVLGSFFRCIAARATPCFIVAPTNDNMTHFKVPLSQDVIDQMADHGRFNLNSICVPTQPETCKLFLSMVFGGSHDEYEDMYEVCSAVPTSFSTDCAPDPPEKDHKRRTPLMNAPVEEN
ncbi:hypothetical protein K461DRAFT_280330 [Myriangium duriaei CBS 260.36]|uniref:Uncharacterized protein n=1 Tax=Myriangium duriaei CBS 260.36 TaxID=1168546 RepID=A0A9P4J0T7_9PEZI|nr:hypothetical protein K461DRAFT_280330 [Myriangium duriaei CBS 260.36]